ncbi:MAG: hypothetical protein KDD62_10645 [Bdellovibrionales bacterium]|nr:hypothetical protein [Bdellovibrionales bacterium]
MIIRIIVATIVLVSIMGCQKRMFPVAMTDEPSDAPEYTVEVNPNK